MRKTQTHNPIDGPIETTKKENTSTLQCKEVKLLSLYTVKTFFYKKCIQSTVSVRQSEGYIFSPKTVVLDVMLAHESRDAGHSSEPPKQNPDVVWHVLHSSPFARDGLSFS